MIKDVTGRTIVNPLGGSAVEVSVRTEYGVFRAAASGVNPEQALTSLLSVKEEFIGASDFESVDSIIKENKESFGCAGTALSLAFFKTLPLDVSSFPHPLSVSVRRGDLEFMIASPGVGSVQDEVRNNLIIHEEIRNRLRVLDNSFRDSINNYGEWVTSAGFNDVLKLVTKVAEEHNARVGLNFSASAHWDPERAEYSFEETLTPEAQISRVQSLSDEFGLAIIENPLIASDEEGLAAITSALPKSLVVSDKISTPTISDAVSAVKIGVQNFGTVSAAWEASDLALSNKLRLIIDGMSALPDPIHARVALAFKGNLFKSGMAGVHALELNELLRLWRPSCKMQKW